MTCPPELKWLYRDGRVIPFVGAGASMAVRWEVGTGLERGPSWREMVDQAARILGFDEADLLRVRGTDLQILEYFKARKGSFAELTNWLHLKMRPKDQDLASSVLHVALAQLTNCRHYYTTNYDDFLERSLSLAGRSPRVIRSERDLSANSDGVQVVKFHGDFNAPDLMVLSESHYEERLLLNSPLDFKLRSDCLARAVLFVGYSFRDSNVAYIFRRINDVLGQLPDSFSGKRAYILVSHPSDFEMRLFQARNIEVIPLYGQDRATSIAEVLGEMSS